MDVLISQQCTTYIHTEAVPHQEVLSLTTKGSWLHLGRVAKPLVSPLIPVVTRETLI